MTWVLAHQWPESGEINLSTYNSEDALMADLISEAEECGQHEEWPDWLGEPEDITNDTVVDVLSGYGHEVSYMEIPYQGPMA